MLSDQTKELICTLSIHYLDTAADLKLSFEDISSISDTRNLVIDLIATTASSTGSNALLDAYSTFIASDMLLGQNRVDITNQQYRISSFALSGDKNATVHPPKTTLKTFSKLQCRLLTSRQIPVARDG
jgi:hypothetical protein